MGNGKAYFFKGSQYVSYDIAGAKVDGGFPKAIAGNWPQWPAAWNSGINAAVNWGDGKAYFFKGDQYLRYDIRANTVDQGYPRPIAGAWAGLTKVLASGFDAVIAPGSDAKMRLRGAHYHTTNLMFLVAGCSDARSPMKVRTQNKRDVKRRIVMRKVLTVFAVASCVMPASADLTPAIAFGAIAIGQTANGVAVDGIAVGETWGYPTQDEANQAALTQCRSYQNQTAAKECRVADTFHDQCFAIAFDPGPNRSGAGIAIANDQDGAKSQALSNCKASAGSDRAQFCKVVDSNCDGQ